MASVLSLVLTPLWLDQERESGLLESTEHLSVWEAGWGNPVAGICYFVGSLFSTLPHPKTPDTS